MAGIGTGVSSAQNIASGETPTPAPAILWSIVIPYFNERDFIARTIDSALSQKGPRFRLILVDNASTDGSEDLCRALLAAAPHVEVRYLKEPSPGHIHALATGFDAVDTTYMCFWDADTWYPDDYLAQAQALLDDGRSIAAMAIDVYCVPGSFAWKVRLWRMLITSWLLSHQAHTGTFGQCFRSDMLRAAGGPKSPGWPYVLYDHELMQRVLKLGPSRYSRKLWCMPSDRRTAKADVRWTLLERILYHATPFRLKDWFFYCFLAKRFEARRLSHLKIRAKDWQ